MCTEYVHFYEHVKIAINLSELNRQVCIFGSL